jgi:hypothetical protein
LELPDAESLTAPGRVPGAFGYISDQMMVDPEGADGVPADVFALAKVLWVLLTPGALFPLQGRHRADGGPGSLQRTLALSNADGLDRRLEGGHATAPSSSSASYRNPSGPTAWPTMTAAA